jgi:hypothetical protein
VKAGQKPGYPRFRSRDRSDSFAWHFPKLNSNGLLVPNSDKRVVNAAVGFDVGLSTLATLSDGTEIENPHWTRQYEDRIAAANRLLTRKQKRSKNRAQAREALRRAHQRAANARSVRPRSSVLGPRFPGIAVSSLLLLR